MRIKGRWRIVEMELWDHLDGDEAEGAVAIGVDLDECRPQEVDGLVAVPDAGR